MPWAFTQEGMVMLSGVLNSPRVVAGNREVMHALMMMWQVVAVNAELAKRFVVVEAKLD